MIPQSWPAPSLKQRPFPYRGDATRRERWRARSVSFAGLFPSRHSIRAYGSKITCRSEKCGPPFNTGIIGAGTLAGRLTRLLSGREAIVSRPLKGNVQISGAVLYEAPIRTNWAIANPKKTYTESAQPK